MLPGLPEDQSNREDKFRRAFSAGASGDSLAALDLPEGGTSVANYVWLPIRFDDTTPVVEWHDQWRIEDYE